MAELSLVFDLELLEDLHAGSGVGRLGLVDDTQARDSRDLPVVWASAFRGLLREAGRDWLEERRAAELPPGLERAFERLFGQGGEGGGVAQILSLRYEREDGREPFHLWASTAREAHSRRPAEQTLRLIEFASAGGKFRGEIRLPGGVGEEDRLFLERCLKRVTALGGRRTRGWGQVKLHRLEWKRLPEPAGGHLAESVPPGRCRLRLVLRNLEPLNVAQTAFAGNLIHARSFIPGSGLRGAILHWLNGRGHRSLTDRLAACLRVGYAYPVAGLTPEQCLKVEVLPAPLSLREPKGGGSDTANQGPWWAGAESADQRLGCRGERDLLACPLQEGERVPLKRIKTEDYLQRHSGPWERRRPRMGVTLRNQVPTDRLDPRQDREAEAGDQEDAFFSAQVLWEDQLFVADLHLDDPTLAAELARATAALWAPDKSVRSWLRVGRGGRPVRVEHAAWREERPNVESPKPDVLTITLTSDLIARTQWLNFHTELCLDVIVDALRMAGREAPARDELSCTAFSEPTEVHGYNSATGLPRATALAVRRGSVLRLTGKSSRAQEHVAAWRTTLRDLQHAGLGERTEDGFGRFVLDLTVHEPGSYAQKPVDPAASVQPEGNWHEEVLAAVETFLDGNRHLADRRGKDAPSVTQWQWLRARAGSCRSQPDIDALWQDLESHASRLAGKAQWGRLLAPLKAAVGQAGTPQRQAYFLDQLARHIVARMSEHGGKE